MITFELRVLTLIEMTDITIFQVNIKFIHWTLKCFKTYINFYNVSNISTSTYYHFIDKHINIMQDQHRECKKIELNYKKRAKY